MNQPTKKPTRSAKLQALLAPADAVATTIAVHTRLEPKRPPYFGE